MDIGHIADRIYVRGDCHVFVIFYPITHVYLSIGVKERKREREKERKREREKRRREKEEKNPAKLI